MREEEIGTGSKGGVGVLWWRAQADLSARQVLAWARRWSGRGADRVKGGVLARSAFGQLMAVAAAGQG